MNGPKDALMLIRRTMLVTGAAALVVGAIACRPETDDRSAVDISMLITGMGQAIDGDSLSVNGTAIRLWGIDAVELNQTCNLDGQLWQCGQSAKSALAAIIAGKPLTCAVRNTDRYGRTVAECFLKGDRTGKTSLNGLIVERGWAMAYQRYAKQYIPHETHARAEQRGIWASRFVPPWDWRQGQRLVP
jgi:endonuclease YncB( thermonuclease family)